MLKKEGVPFYPKAISKDLIFSAVVILGILGCAAYFGPKGPTGVPDPTQIDTVPRPDFFFLWMFSALALLPDYMETVLILTAPVVIIGVLFALPFISGTGEKSAHRLAGFRADRHRYFPDAGNADLPGNLLALVAGHECVER